MPQRALSESFSEKFGVVSRDLSFCRRVAHFRHHCSGVVDSERRSTVVGNRCSWLTFTKEGQVETPRVAPLYETLNIV